MYKVMLISALQQVIQLHIYIYLIFFKFFSYLDYYRVLSKVPFAIQ